MLLLYSRGVPGDARRTHMGPAEYKKLASGELQECDPVVK